MWNIGTDTGGTFTDLVAIDDLGQVRVAKTPSTPPEFEAGVLNALREVGVPANETRLLYHGTTVSTNALLTRTGARTAQVSTSGFRDVIEIRDGSRNEAYDILWDPPPPLVSRPNRLEVTERLDYAGTVVKELDEDEVRRVAATLRARGIEAVAITFVHSYANPAHEARVREILEEELPGVYLSVSSDLLPEPPEFPRASTTVANAYVGPVLRSYVKRLSDAASADGYGGRLVIMHSGGGTMTPENVVRSPIRTATSGPAAGVLAAAAIGATSGRPDIVSFDVGGTSADIATIRDGRPQLSTEQSLEWGMPIGFPSIDLVTLGAGGGSIAWIDDAGIPHVGPQSAGARPGPAAYGRGGTEPTVTDAVLTMGRLRSGSLLGVGMSLDADAAREAVRARFADPLGLGIEEAAEGIIRIANQNMANGIRRVTVQRGLDPRDFTLLAFGGAGPMVAIEIAREVGMTEVLVPVSPGATSALGLLFADARHDLMRSMIAPADALQVDSVGARFFEMEQEARDLLAAEGFSGDGIRLERLIDLRYIGQVRALGVPLPAGEIRDADISAAVASFHEAYEREFKYAVPDLPVESKALRVVAIGVTDKPTLALSSVRGTWPRPSSTSARPGSRAGSHPPASTTVAGFPPARRSTAPPSSSSTTRPRSCPRARRAGSIPTAPSSSS